MNGWLDVILYGDFSPALGGPQTVAIVMFFSFCIGHVIGWVYVFTHTGLSYSQMFVVSLVAIPVIVGLVMILMAGNIVIAFGLLAVFAVVRFRNVLKDTRDTTFILWAIVQGMAVGTMRFSTALLGCLGICAVFLYLRFTSFGIRHRYDAVLSLQLTGDLAGALASLKQVLRRHSMRVELASERKLTQEGLDLFYRLLLRDPSRSNELRAELEATEGIEHVALSLREDESEI